MTRDCLLHVQTTSYKPPVTHRCRLALSHGLMQAKGVGDRVILETYLNSGSKNTSETDIFPNGTKSLLTSVIGEPVLNKFMIFCVPGNMPVVHCLIRCPFSDLT
jgi:hypothetical protein